MDTIPFTPRPTLDFLADEKTQAGLVLDYYRHTILQKCSGLSRDDLARVTIPSSELTLLGILRHVTGCEEYWFQEIFEGNDHPDYSYDASVDPDVDFHDLTSHSLAEVVANFDRAVAATKAICANASMDDRAKTERDGQVFTLRSIMLHMIEEYARHAGHADIIRELIDGTTGY